jgi:hypothetical protein
VAVIEPGPDFVDKAAGYDSYSKRIIQPFALIDSLLRLGLAKANELQIFSLSLRLHISVAP